MLCILLLQETHFKASQAVKGTEIFFFKSYFLLIETKLHLSFFVLAFGIASDGMGEGNGTPLQYSCLENPMDGGA